MLRRGQVWVANLNPRHGIEPGKTRPVLVVQPQALLDASHPSTQVVPLTTVLVEDADPLRIRVAAADKLQRDSAGSANVCDDHSRSVRLRPGYFRRTNGRLLKRVSLRSCRNGPNTEGRFRWAIGSEKSVRYIDSSCVQLVILLAISLSCSDRRLSRPDSRTQRGE